MHLRASSERRSQQQTRQGKGSKTGSRQGQPLDKKFPKQRDANKHALIMIGAA